jgi:hypothetical protein
MTKTQVEVITPVERRRRLQVHRGGDGDPSPERAPYSPYACRPRRTAIRVERGSNLQSEAGPKGCAELDNVGSRLTPQAVPPLGAYQNCRS